MKNERLLNKLYNPNDRLGVQFFGVDEWNRQKANVCDITNDVIEGKAIPAYRTGADYSQLFNVLFVPDRRAFGELLGATAPLDYIPGSWTRSFSKVASGATDILDNVPVLSPFIKGGRSINQGLADFLEKLGLKSYKDSDEPEPLTVTQKAGLGLGGLLLIGGAAYGLYYLSKKKKGRR